MIHLLAADGNGFDSVTDTVEAHPDKLKVTSVLTYKAFDEACRDIMRAVTPGDVVVLDTVTTLANTTRGDLKVGVDKTLSYWDESKKWMADATTRNAYGAAGQMILRRLKDLRAAGARIIVTAHESEREDTTSVPPVRKRAPDANADLLGGLVAAASDVVRLRVVTEPILDAKGNVRVPARARLIELGPSEEFMSKVHVPIARVADLPKIIGKPSLPKLYKALGKVPSWLVLYGPAGAGKTTLAVSELTDPDARGQGL